MSFFPLQLQIASDLHLETPVHSPSYTTFQLSVRASNLCLLGDIGLVRDLGLFTFLRRLLTSSPGTRIFYVLGNHEAYQTTLQDAVKRLQDFENESKENYGGRFVFLHRRRYDVDAQTTILGCTLWSAVAPEQRAEAQGRLTDLNEERGIGDWSLEAHLEEHNRDVTWLNEQVQTLQIEEPQRQVAILTHHCPTFDTRAVDPRHQGSSMSTAFATDLSTELCWTSPAVKLWAWGHTHFSCAFHEEKSGKLFVANQRGYSNALDSRQRAKKMPVKVVEAGSDMWKVVSLQQDTGMKLGSALPASSPVAPSDDTPLSGSDDTTIPATSKQSFFQRVCAKLRFHH